MATHADQPRAAVVVAKANFIRRWNTANAGIGSHVADAGAAVAAKTTGAPVGGK
ncbi:MAG: hypothetical protein ACJ797_06200 [Ktedonobacteraceae bacterium]